MSVNFDIDTDYGINLVHSETQISVQSLSFHFSDHIFTQYSHIQFTKEAVVVTKQSSFGEKSKQVFMQRVDVNGKIEGEISWKFGPGKDNNKISGSINGEVFDNKGNRVGGGYRRNEDGSHSISANGAYSTESKDKKKP